MPWKPPKSLIMGYYYGPADYDGSLYETQAERDARDDGGYREAMEVRERRKRREEEEHGATEREENQRDTGVEGGANGGDVFEAVDVWRQATRCFDCNGSPCVCHECGEA